MVTSKELHHYGIGMLLIIVLVLGMINIESTPPLWWDEGWLLSIARNWVELGLYGRLLHGKPISSSLTNGFPVIAPIALSFKLFGVGTWQGRIPIEVFSMGALVLVYYLAYRLYGTLVAIGTLSVLILIPAYQDLHPILMGRQVLGEMPVLFYLLAGYGCFLRTEDTLLWAMPAVVFWAIALITKLQVLPFLMAALLLPLAVALMKRIWRVASLLAFALVGSVVVSRLLLWLLQLLLHNPTLPIPQTTGLYEVTAVVSSIPARLFALIVLFSFGMPTLFGLCYGLWSFVRDKNTLTTHTNTVRLSLLVLASSWFAWYVTLSVGWIRYLFPATFVGSVFVAAMVYELTNGFSLSSTIRQGMSALTDFNFNRRSLGALLVIVLIATSVPRTLFMLYKSYVLDSDASVQQVAQFLNTHTASGALVETYDSELFFLLDRPYHYPPDQIHIDLNRRTFLYEDLPIDYDPLAENPDYLVIGPHSRQWRLYDRVLKTGAFHLLRAYHRYTVYERVR